MNFQQVVVIALCCATIFATRARAQSQNGTPQNVEDIFDAIASGIVNIIGLPRRGVSGNDSAVATDPQNVLDIVDAIQSGSLILLGMGGDGKIAASQPQDYQQLLSAIGKGIMNIVGIGDGRQSGNKGANGTNATEASTQPQSIVEIVRAVQRGSLVILGLPRRGLTDANQNQGRTRRSVGAISGRAD